jgi:hypothetical protein
MHLLTFKSRILSTFEWSQKWALYLATIFRVIPPARPAPGPTYEAVDVFVDHGSRHFQESPGQPALVHRLLAWLQHWQVSHVIADATGAGEGLVDWLAAALGQSRITPFKFTPTTKAQLGSSFLSLIETGRFKYWTDDPSSEPCTLHLVPGGPADPDSHSFFTQAAACSYSLPPTANSTAISNGASHPSLPSQ